MEYVESFKGLEVYLLARELANDIFDISKKFPKEEMYSLTVQVRRSSRSTGGQIAEAWGKRRYEKHFLSKLTDAGADQMETQHWIETATDGLYISKEQALKLLNKCNAIEKMLNSMINKSTSFCKKPST